LLFFACSEDLVGFDTQRDAFWDYGSLLPKGGKKADSQATPLPMWQLIGPPSENNARAGERSDYFLACYHEIRSSKNLSRRLRSSIKRQ